MLLSCFASFYWISSSCFFSTFISRFSFNWYLTLYARRHGANNFIHLCLLPFFYFRSTLFVPFLFSHLTYKKIFRFCDSLVSNDCVWFLCMLIFSPCFLFANFFVFAALLYPKKRKKEKRIYSCYRAYGLCITDLVLCKCCEKKKAIQNKADEINGRIINVIKNHLCIRLITLFEYYVCNVLYIRGR